MAKMILTYDTETHEDAGDSILAFVHKPCQSDSGKGRVDAHLIGCGNGLSILAGTARALGALVPELVDGQTKRTLTYARMIQALGEGFDSQGVEIADIGYPTDGKEARDDEPCDAAGEPEEEADGI